uniref:Uncharacterized protein n=1 Tax=Chrysemys picta bellii TaxID=8478 RepID=A0A8C3F677_CHRPI
MGAHLVRRYLIDAEVEPDPLRMPTFDARLGFPERKERGEPGPGPAPLPWPRPWGLRFPPPAPPGSSIS